MNEYQNNIRRFQKSALYETEVTHALLGIGSEAGEILDAIKKPWFSPRDDVPKIVDRKHLEEEIGDLLFYVCWLATLFRIDIDDAAAANIAKLERRYAEKK